MKLPNFLSRPALTRRTPVPLALPAMYSVRVDLQYHRARSGGDFFDALAIDASRLVFLFMDIAGQRIGAMELGAFAQDDFRSRAPELFTGEINEAEALSELCMHLNRTILTTAGRAHMTAAFLGVFNSNIGALAYINAGHVPGLLLAPDTTEFLESTGLPLGLFSHATHEAGFRVTQLSHAGVLVWRIRRSRCASLNNRPTVTNDLEESALSMESTRALVGSPPQSCSSLTILKISIRNNSRRRSRILPAVASAWPPWRVPDQRVGYKPNSEIRPSVCTHQGPTVLDLLPAPSPGPLASPVVVPLGRRAALGLVARPEKFRR